jgi:protein SCO1/2/putative membrane protein
MMPEWVSTLPTFNALLNALATVLLVTGLGLIKRGKRKAHERVMLAAFGVSVAFLASYLIYHAWLGSKPFAGTGPVRTVYFAILISHVVLAAIVPVLAVVTIYRGLKQQWERHKRIAKVTFPIWLYVSITGVIIYVMLYHWV